MTWATSDKYVVLIVDDAPANLAMLSDTLDESGHMVLVATDGQSALDRLDYATPDIILLDAMMPGMDGFETCRRMKRLNGSRHIPVVFMTGLTETEHVLKGFHAGGIDYVAKPIQPAEVIARIDTHVRNARLLSTARAAIDAAENAVIALDHQLKPLWHTSKVQAWLEKYFPEAAFALPELPPRLQTWLHQNASSADADESAPSLLLSRRNGRLTIRLTKSKRGGENLLLLRETNNPGANPRDASCSGHIADYNLTPREADVLAWLAKGKTNRDIAEILGMSPRTVNKHLEHIFVKLGVETRSAAAALSVGWLQKMPGSDSKLPCTMVNCAA